MAYPGTAMELVVQSGGTQGQAFALSSEAVTLGRDRASDIVLHDALVSRHHATLHVLPDGNIRVTDLNSANGTYINGKRIIETHILRPGDTLRLGSYVLLLQHHVSAYEGTNVTVSAAFPSDDAQPAPPATYDQRDLRSTIILPAHVASGLPGVALPDMAVLPSPADSSGDPQEPPASTLALPALPTRPKPVPPVAPSPVEVPVAVPVRRRSRPVKSFWREVLETVTLTIIIFFSVKALIQNFQVVGTSMEPNFHTDEMLLVNKAAYFHFDAGQFLQLIPGSHPTHSTVWPFGEPKRGDIIVFEFPIDTSKDYIKRVIGLPGDSVEIRDGVTYINNVALNEPYIKAKPYEPYPPHVVPPGNLFVMGDNRNGSSDSRAWGMLPIDKIIGKVMFAYAPREDWGVPPEQHYAPIPSGKGMKD